MTETAAPTDAQTGSRQIECSQAELAAQHPEFFTEPTGLATAKAESLEAIDAFTFDSAKEKLDELPYLIGADLVAFKENTPKTVFSSREGFQIPVSRIVAANGYDHDRPPKWSGRVGGYGDAAAGGAQKSLNKIIEYAKRGKYEPADGGNIHAHAMYAPDGEVFFEIEGGNHRASAAKLRGDAALTVKFVTMPDRREDALISPSNIELLYGRTDSKQLSIPEAKTEALDVRINTSINDTIPLGSTIRFDRGKGLESVEVVDALPYVVHDNKGKAVSTYPVIVIKDAQGKKEIIRARDFLAWADDNVPQELRALQKEILQEESAEDAAPVEQATKSQEAEITPQTKTKQSLGRRALTRIMRSS